MRVEVQRLAHAHDLPLPTYATVGSAGLDLVAAIEGEITIAPGRHQAVPTGIALALPAGVEGQVRPRSGLALRHGVTVLNAPGTIDSDYRGEVTAILINHGTTPFTITRGIKIAQLGGIIFVRVRIGGSMVTNVHYEKMLEVCRLVGKDLCFSTHTPELIGYSEAAESTAPIWMLDTPNALRASGKQEYEGITREFLKRF